MAWLDDRIQTHPKIVALSDRAYRAWINCLCYCSMHGTGGHLDAAISVHRIPKTIVRELVRARVWDEEDDGFWVHDWQEHNEKRDEAREEKRAQARERQRRHREKVRLTSQKTNPVTRDSHANVTRDTERDESVTVLAGARPPRARDHDHDQGSRQEQQQNNPNNPALHAAQTNSSKTGKPAAAEPPDQPLSDIDIEQAVRTLPGHDPGSLSQILPLAEHLPAPLFHDALHRTRARIAGGTVTNACGLFVQLLKVAGTEHHQRQAAETQATLETWTAEHDVAHAARSYARGKHPWHVAEELLTHRIERIANNGDQPRLLELAQAAYNNELDAEAFAQ